MRLGNVPIASAVVVFALATAQGAGTLEPHVRIHSPVEVEGEVVTLSDLLPPSAPPDLSEVCRRILLGEAPLAGSRRVISRDQIERQLRGFPSTLKRLDIPAQVMITRKRRRLASSEILAAVQAYLQKQNSRAIPRAEMLRPNLQAPVFVTEADPGLEVRRAEPDRLRGKTRFLLAAAKEPQVLPFYVTLEGLFEAPGPVPATPSASAAPARPRALVTAGKPARLVVERGNVRLSALVTPLESGVKGQLIRVRNQDSLRVLQAEVVDVGLLAVP